VLFSAAYSDKLKNLEEVFKTTKTQFNFPPPFLCFSHLHFYGRYWCTNPFFYIFGEIELIYNLFEVAACMRMMHNYFCIGGVAAGLPYGWTNTYICIQQRYALFSPINLLASDPSYM
jgi:hypothetical protein